MLTFQKKKKKENSDSEEERLKAKRRRWEEEEARYLAIKQKVDAERTRLYEEIKQDGNTNKELYSIFNELQGIAQEYLDCHIYISLLFFLAVFCFISCFYFIFGKKFTFTIFYYEFLVLIFQYKHQKLL